MVEKSELKREKWDHQYRQGTWDYLNSTDEIPRYSVLGSYMKFLGRPISLLDVGCGEGLVLKFCEREWLKIYTGLDISQTALDKIKTLLPTDTLICSTLEDCSINNKFDVILFNEVLYYTSDPESQLMRFRDYLKPEGYILISTYKKSGWFSRNSRGIQNVWRLVEKCKWNKIDEVLITNIPKKKSWRITLIQP